LVTNIDHGLAVRRVQVGEAPCVDTRSGVHDESLFAALAWIVEFDTVLPLGFDTIVRSEDEVDPDQVVKDWLKDDFEDLREKIDRVRGKQEFGIQVFYDPRLWGKSLPRRARRFRS